jgi:hypothetical protein
MDPYTARVLALEEGVLQPLADDLRGVPGVSNGVSHAALAEGLRRVLTQHPDSTQFARHLRSFVGCARLMAAFADQVVPMLHAVFGDANEAGFLDELLATVARHQAVFQTFLAIGGAASEAAPAAPVPPVQAPAPSAAPPPAPAPPRPAFTPFAPAPPSAPHAAPTPVSSEAVHLMTQLASVQAELAALRAVPTASQAGAAQLEGLLRALQEGQGRLEREVSRMAAAAMPARGAMGPDAMAIGAGLLSTSAWRDPANWRRAFGSAGFNLLFTRLREVYFEATESVFAQAMYVALADAFLLAHAAVLAQDAPETDMDSRFLWLWPHLRTLLAATVAAVEYKARSAATLVNGRFLDLVYASLTAMELSAWTDEAVRKTFSDAAKTAGKGYARAARSRTRTGRAESSGRSPFRRRAPDPAAAPAARKRAPSASSASSRSSATSRASSTRSAGRRQ